MADSPEIVKKKRGGRVNPKQKKILFQFMAEYPHMFAYKITPEFTVKHHKLHWERISVALNLFGPPKKTAECWKKAWKDLKQRCRKAGVDLKDVMNRLRKYNVVNTRLLMDKVDTMCSSKQKIELDQTLKESIFRNSLDVLLPEIFNSKYEFDVTRYGSDISLGIDDSGDLRSNTSDGAIVKHENSVSKDEPEDLYEVAYEEISESDLDDLAESDNTYSLAAAEDNVKRFRDCLSEDLDSDEDELEVQNASKRNRTSDSDDIKKLEPEIDISADSLPAKSDSKTNILEDLLQELREHNNLQKQKLTLRKEHLEFKKQILERSLSTQKEIAEAQILLSRSIKTFVDSISFNT